MCKHRRRVVAMLYWAILIGSVFRPVFGREPAGAKDGPAPGAHFVAVDGKATWDEATDPAGPCSPEAAFANAKAGDTVYFRAGTYRVGQSEHYKGVWGPANSGTAEKPIVFTSYPGEKVVFAGKPEVRGQGRAKNYVLATRALGNQWHDYIVFDGFHFVAEDRTGFCGVIISRSNGGDFKNRPEKWAKGCVVRNCSFDGGDFAIGSHPQDNPNSADNNEVVRIEESNGALIQNCRMWNVRHVKNNHNVSAVKMYHNRNATIEHCEIYNCSTAIFDKSNGQNSVFRWNYVHDCAEALLLTSFGWKDPKAPNGYFMSCHPGCQVYHNLFCNAGNIVDDTGDGSHSSGLTIYNNTLYAGNGSYVGMAIGNGTGKAVYNNIFFGERRDGDLGLLRFMGSDNDVAVPQTPLEIAACDHNQFGGLPGNLLIRVRFRKQTPYCDNFASLAAWQGSGKLVGGGSPGQGSLDCDPRFVNASGKFSELADFRLAPDSPCRKAGRDGMDMGADIEKVGVRAK
jgi:hypothetical protein